MPLIIQFNVNKEIYSILIIYLFYLFLQKVICIFLINYDRYKGLPSSGLMFFFWGLLALLAGPLIYSNFIDYFLMVNDGDRLFRLNSSNFSFIASCLLIVLNVFVTCVPYDIDENEKFNRNICPHYRTSIISRLTHNWITRYVEFFKILSFILKFTRF